MLNSAEISMSAALPFLSLEEALILPVCTVPVRLVTVILPPLLSVEWESRLPLRMSPLAFRSIGPAWELVRLPVVRLLAA
jgi:hypothetical protein